MTAASKKISSPPPADTALCTEPQVRFLSVTAEYEGQRLDNFLFRELKGVPKTHVYRLIRQGGVRRNKGRVQADSRVAQGDTIRIPPLRLGQGADEKRRAQERKTPARGFPVVQEDESLLAINKPAGVAVHGGSGVDFGVIEQLRKARPDLLFLELVHRLDRETSGLLLLAKKKSALSAVQAQFRERSIDKHYLALVWGAWPAACKVIDTPLHKYLDAAGERRVRTVGKDHPDAMTAVSLVQVRAVLDLPGLGLCSLLGVKIKTGRTHQIRVHLASKGHPIVGDEKYGDFAGNKLAQKAAYKGMFLHAWRLRIQHPKTQTELSLAASVPQSWQALGLPGLDAVAVKQEQKSNATAAI